MFATCTNNEAAHIDNLITALNQCEYGSRLVLANKRCDVKRRRPETYSYGGKLLCRACESRECR